jgi:hypothetical protein
VISRRFVPRLGQTGCIRVSCNLLCEQCQTLQWSFKEYVQNCSNCRHVQHVIMHMSHMALAVQLHMAPGQYAKYILLVFMEKGNISTSSAKEQPHVRHEWQSKQHLDVI